MCQMSQLLFARPSFLEGVSRILDLGCTLDEYNRSLSGEMADAKAIASDWHAVGQDLQNAIDAVNGQKTPEVAHAAPGRNR